jgi:hypothetical protein
VGKSPLERHRRGWEDNIIVDIQKVDVVVLTGSSWLRIGTVGGQLLTKK